MLRVKRIFQQGLVVFGMNFLLAGGLVTVFTYIGIVVLIAMIVYGFYQYYQWNPSYQQANHFAIIQHSRETLQARVEGFTAAESLRLQAKTDDILTEINTNQTQLGEIIASFTQQIQSIETLGEDFKTSNFSFEEKIIIPYKNLLLVMQQKFKQLSVQTEESILALNNAMASISLRERELAAIITELTGLIHSLEPPKDPIESRKPSNDIEASNPSPHADHKFKLFKPEQAHILPSFTSVPLTTQGRPDGIFS